MASEFQNAAKTATMWTSSAAKSKGLNNIYRMELHKVPNLTGKIIHFIKNVDGTVIQLLGPLPNGNTLLRVTSLTRHGRRPLKAHVEISLNSQEAIKFSMMDEFYQTLATKKLTQYIGYVAEDTVMHYAKSGALDKMMYFQAYGRNVAKPYNRTIKPQSVFSIQNSSGHGIDFIGELTPPPENQWITMDVKATLKGSFAEYGTPKTPPLSEAQRDALTNLYNHAQEATNLYSMGKNSYKLEPQQYDSLLRFINDYEIAEETGVSCIKAYELKVGMVEGYEVASNTKYPTMMVLNEIKGK